MTSIGKSSLRCPSQGPTPSSWLELPNTSQRDSLLGNWRRSIGYRPFIHIGCLLRPVGSCRMELILWKFFAKQRVELTKFSKAQAPPIFLSISQPSLSWLSISKLRKNSDLQCQSRCSPAPTG